MICAAPTRRPTRNFSTRWPSDFRRQRFRVKSICCAGSPCRGPIRTVPSRPNRTRRIAVNYSRHYRHRLRAEVLMDAIADVTETSASLDAMPSESRANQVWTTRVDSIFLDTFGRPNENQDPPCERTPDGTMTQALHLMNSNELDRRIRSDSGRAARSGRQRHDRPEKSSKRSTSRRSLGFPSDANSTLRRQLLNRPRIVAIVLEDLMWAMINAPEFSIQD